MAWIQCISILGAKQIPENYYQMQTFLEMNDSNVNNVNNFLFSILDIT